MTSQQAFVTVAIIAAATFATRSFAFLLFPAGKSTPKYVNYLGKALPCATMGMLVIYCLKGVTPTVWPHGLPELAAVVLVALVQFRWRNTLASILSGTVLYMILLRVL